CPGSRLGRSDCAQPLFDYSNTGMSVICPSCGQVWEQAAVIGEIFFRLPMYKWAVVLHRYFHQFDCNCDIYLKHAPDDIRSVSLAQAAKATWEGSKKLARVRDKRARFVYPPHNILVDTSAGADLISRFRAFLTA